MQQFIILVQIVVVFFVCFWLKLKNKKSQNLSSPIIKGKNEQKRRLV